MRVKCITRVCSCFQQKLRLTDDILAVLILFVSAEGLMKDLSAAAPGLVREAIQVIKVPYLDICMFAQFCISA